MNRQDARIRYGVCAAAAAAVSLGLFLFMVGLIPRTVPESPGPDGRSIRFGLVPPQEPTALKSRRLIKPRRVRKPPAAPAVDRPPARFRPKASAPVSMDHTRWDLVGLTPPGLPEPPGLGGFGTGEGLVPLALLPPMYPPRGLRMGIEGEVLVRFTVGPKGRVIRAEVVSADPPNLFEAATLRAVNKWRFEPVIIDGEPGNVTAEQVIAFTLVDEDLFDPGY